MATEIELKLAIRPEDISILLNHPLLASSNNSCRELHLQGSYFDTPEHDLFSKNISLRVRREGEHWIQTIKFYKTNTNNIHQRYEWETEVETQELELDKLPTEVRETVFAESQFRQSITRIFNVDVKRILWDLTSEEGSKIEFCIDQGNVSNDNTSAAIYEIELELKSGNPACLDDMALKLLENIPLQIESRSKSQRGYELLKPALVTFHKQDIIALPKNMSVEEVFIKSVQQCIGHIQENEAITLLGGEPEGVHQIRVALRRLRSILTFYKPLIPTESYLELKPQIKWICKLLGPVRDWDVFILSVQDMLQNDPLDTNLLDILHNANKEQNKYQDQLLHAMKSTLYTRFFLSLSLWLQQRPWRDYLNNKQLSKLDGKVKQFTNKRLRKIYNKLLSHGGDTPSQLSPTERHKVRIKSKELAYSLRFLFSLYSRAEIYLEILSNMRDDLGMLNDNYTAQDLFKNPTLDPLYRQGSDFFRGWYSARESIALNDLDNNWAIFLLQPDVTRKNP